MRTALVTGAGERTLGAATADALRAKGFRVLTTTRSCPVTADTHPLDLTDRESVARLAAWVPDRLDVLVNNAGIHLDLLCSDGCASWPRPWSGAR
jgi:NAD(P)-dependent dehydrogenase (short-subunit alcohol dehydrogenase family)